MRTVTPSEPTNILLVEDNPGDATLISDAFDQVADDVRVHTVSDGAEAMSYLSDHRETGSFPDLLLLDLNVPRVHGLDLLETLQEESELVTLPVIVLTSSQNEDDIAESYDRHANAYLTKPNSHDEYVSLARAVDEFWVRTAQLPSVTAA